MIYKSIAYFLSVILICLLSACKYPGLPTRSLAPTTFANLPNWTKDHLTEAWPAFVRSCLQIHSDKSDRPSAMEEICTRAMMIKKPTEADIRNFFETNFTPYKVKVRESDEGLFTGYYEPLLAGSRIKTKRFTAPLYQKPNDLITINDLGIFRKDLQGIGITGRLVDSHLQPYYTHEEIDTGILKGNELIWIEDPIDAFFAQIQGSITIKLENGQFIHLSYAGQNGQPYTAIGKVLIERKALSRENINMRAIRTWLKEHPEQAKEVLYQNASFVFFKESKIKGALGDEGVVLTPGRSLAVDPAYISYGTPIWLDISHHISQECIQRLVIAQDKGGAIKGPVRGDLFWGTGKTAGELAGVMKSKGSYYLLLPNSYQSPSN